MTTRAQRVQRRNAEVIAVLSDRPMRQKEIADALDWGSNRSLLTHTLGVLCQQEYVAEVMGEGPRRYVLGQRLWRKRPI